MTATVQNLHAAGECETLHCLWIATASVCRAVVLLRQFRGSSSKQN